MVTETRTDYETVEKEYEVTICDCCKETKDDDQIETVAVNPEYESTRRSRRLAAGEFGVPDYRQALPNDTSWAELHKKAVTQMQEDLADEKGRLRAEVHTLRSQVEDLKQIPEGKLATDCTFDVCQTCLKGVLDIVPAEEHDHVESPRIVERDVEIDPPKLLGLRSMTTALGLMIVGLATTLTGFNPYIPGFLSGMSILIVILFFTQRWPKHDDIEAAFGERDPP